MYAWQFSKALYLQRINGWHRFVTMQDHYNLLNREEEREMYPLCADQGVGVIPWSPLARGRLTRPWGETTSRSETDTFGKTLYDESTDRVIVERVAEVAAERGVSRLRSRWPGCWPTRWSPHRSSAWASRPTWLTPWRRWIWS